MPNFFFHLRTPEGLARDEIGLALPDFERAYLEACDAIPGMSADFARQGLSPLAYGFVIADEAGTMLAEVPFAERLRDDRRLARPGQHKLSRRLSRELASVIATARETVQRSRDLLARSRQS